jgi:hypothetical protein
MVLMLSGCNAAADYQPRNGDLIFQTSLSRQSEAIQLATHSPLSHMGIVFVENGQAMVFEAVGPVKATPLEDWISMGDEERYSVKRLKNAESVLTPETLQKMKKIGEAKFKGRPYDKFFAWSDDRIYCSELAWKIYQEGAGVEIGALQRLGDLDLSAPLVQELMKERYGNAIPWDETVISPAAMFASEELILVFEN